MSCFELLACKIYFILCAFVLNWVCTVKHLNENGPYSEDTEDRRKRVFYVTMYPCTVL
jgi:hypothetical protein